MLFRWKRLSTHRNYENNWSESLGGNFSFGLVQIIGILVIAVPLFLLGSLANFFVGIALVVFAGLFIITIVNAAQAIFISAIYHCVQGEEVRLASNDQENALFERKNRKMW